MRHDDDHGRHDKRFRLKVRHVVLGLFVALLATAVLHMAMLSSGANRRIEALRAAGQPTSLAEFALRNKLPMGMDNAAPLYENAFAAYTSPEDANVPYVGKLSDSPDRKAPLQEPVAQATAECLAANEKCLALLREASAVETCRYEYDYRKGYPQLEKFRRCAQLLKLAAVCHARKGDAEAAVGCIKDGLCLGDSLRQEPLLLPYLLRSGCVGLAITGLERVLSLTTLTDSQLKDLDVALATTAGRTDLVHAIATERCFVIDAIRDPSLTGTPGMGVTILKLPGIRSQGLIDILDYMAACIKAAGLPREQQAKRFHEVATSLDGLSQLHVMAKITAPALGRISELDSRAHAHLDLARTGLAIERYRLANGTLPEQLADLVPAYLEQVPIDPFDGQPIRYRRTEPGYILYSIMEDGKDNGGKEREQVGKNEPYDLCFIVAR
jgi:hypothetical protein